MIMEKYNTTCDNCNHTHSVDRTSEIPKHVVSMGCNWCPKCEYDADDYYDEWYNESDDRDPQPDSPPPNQLNLFPIYPTEIDFEVKKNLVEA